MRLPNTPKISGNFKFVCLTFIILVSIFIYIFLQLGMPQNLSPTLLLGMESCGLRRCYHMQ